MEDVKYRGTFHLNTSNVLYSVSCLGSDKYTFKGNYHEGNKKTYSHTLAIAWQVG